MPAERATPVLMRRLPFYYGWVNLAVAVVAIVGTLPGRTWGLGLITEPLLKDLGLERDPYANLNFWATIFGAAFCLPVGRLIDRFGCRIVLTLVTLGLGVTVVTMSRVSDTRWLFPLVLSTRAFGQSALSIVSVALIGKWFHRRVSSAMTAWAVTMILGFAAAERALGYAVNEFGWRTAWSATGWLLVAGLAPLGWIFARSTPEQYGLSIDGESVGTATESEADESSFSLTLGETLLTPAFWVLALALSLNSLTQSGIGLFGVSLVRQLELGDEVFVQMMVIATFAALPGNLLTGWFANAWSLRRLNAIGMCLLALSLPVLPMIKTSLGIILFSTVWGLACGVISVSMNAIWGRVFGRLHLGKIQGAVAVCHVLSSAGGPKVMVWSLNTTGKYGPFFYVSALVAAVLALAVWVVPFPQSEPSREPDEPTTSLEPAVAVAAAAE
ncbi:MAG TPA: MFS transporter [Pirellulales bacterium]|nr:MFS transporter [Pirellulales bacterium]